MFEKSTTILSAFGHTTEELPASCHAKIVDFPEVGYDPKIFWPQQHKLDSKSEVRRTFLFAGRLVPYKLPSLLVKCFANSKKLQDHRLLIVGEGPERPEMEWLVNERKLQNCVEFVGSKPQIEVAGIMRSSDAFVFPSIRELGAGVVVEAMACGLPCIAIDHGGPAGLLADDRGVLIPLGDREHLVNCFINAMHEVIDHPSRSKQHAAKSLEYVEKNLTWDAKAMMIARIYDQLC